MIAATRLETPRLVLRPPAASDIDAAVGFFADDRSIHVGGPLDAGRGWRAFASLAGHWALLGYGPYVLTSRETGEPLGLVGPWHPGDWPEAELSWTIWSPRAEGQGYAFEAAARVLDHLATDLGWPALPSYIDPANGRSIALATRLGATPDASAALPPRLQDLAITVYRHRAVALDDDGGVEAYA
jgi:RimJ/RimL family protein N-acetyltransferase